MSNRRRPQRRDAHGAPVRPRKEIWIAVGTGAGVLLVTVILILWLQNEPVGPAGRLAVAHHQDLVAEFAIHDGRNVLRRSRRPLLHSFRTPTARPLPPQP